LEETAVNKTLFRAMAALAATVALLIIGYGADAQPIGESIEMKAPATTKATTKAPATTNLSAGANAGKAPATTKATTKATTNLSAGLNAGKAAGKAPATTKASTKALMRQRQLLKSLEAKPGT
jgi:hypothetical protein